MPLVVGLVLSHIIGTVYVWQSNVHIYQQSMALESAGWLAIPGGGVVQTLLLFGSAFRGGLFYTLSVGAILSLTAWALALLKIHFFPNSRAVTWALATIWVAIVVAVNTNGLAIAATLFAVCIPLATTVVTLWFTVRKARGNSPWLRFIPVFVLLGLTLLWSTQSKDLFITIRDHVLLSNPIGRSINDFYYRNTLFAAEAFKGFHQKDIRTCNLDAVNDQQLAKRLENQLAVWSILNVSGLTTADMIIQYDGRNLLLTSMQGNTLRVKPNVFLKDIGGWLDTFAKANDSQAPFRMLVLVGVVIGFPVLLFTTVYGLLGMVAGLFLQEPRATWATSGFCLLIGVLLFLPMLSARHQDVSRNELPRALQSDDRNHRLAALRQIESQKLDITGISDYRHLMVSDEVAVRYWLARALAHSRGPSAFRNLLILIRDPHPNVVCQAYYALGQRGDRKAVEPIKTQMLQSEHWYTQFYGYRAIRKLGWRQTKSH
jgi:hypothetical protein